jgi:hypothetical protein
MRHLEEKLVDLSTLVGSQFPSFVSENNRRFIKFLSSYYESLETKYQPLDIISNLLDYYNIKNFISTELIEHTQLTASVSLSDDTISVVSTQGFPETNGYIKINGEIIFYRYKTPTSFNACVRGTSAFILETVPSSNVVLTDSTVNPDTKNGIHQHNVEDKVENIAFTFTSEFLRRVTAEISPNLPKRLVSDLNLNNFLSQVKSFYTAKGSLNSHKILFKILFNDKKIKLRLINRGRGAKIVLTNYTGGVGFRLPDIVKSVSTTSAVGATNIYLTSLENIEVGDEVFSYKQEVDQDFNVTNVNILPAETIVISKNIEESYITINYPIQQQLYSGTQITFRRIVGYSIIDGGEGYDNRKDAFGNLINAPVIEVIGSGFGIKNERTNIIPQTAIVKVTDIDENGTITQVNIFNQGTDYIGPITARIRERTFNQDQIVVNSSGTGTGRVEFWDVGSNELTLYNTTGYFRVDDELIGKGAENPRSFISKAYPRTDINKKGNPSVQVVSLDPEIEFPKDYTIKPSSSTYLGKQVIHCKITNNSLYKTVNNKVVIPRLLSLIQEEDLESGIKGVNLEVTEFNNISKDVYEFSIESNSDYKNLVSVPSTKVVIEKNGQYDPAFAGIKFNAITVDDTTGFPLEQGYLYIDGRLFVYSSRSANQFFDCVYIGEETQFTITVNTEVFAYGRNKKTIQFAYNEVIKEGDYRYLNDRLYVALNSGVTGLNEIVHTEGVREVDGIAWQYEGNNVIKYFLNAYIDGDFTQDPIELLPLGLISDINIENHGSLYTSTSYEFDRVLTNKRTEPAITSWKINLNNTISNVNLPSYENTTGVNSVYEYDNYSYITSSGIPPYLESITGRRFCYNQKLLRRIPLSIQKGKGIVKESKKNIGITVDGVEIQSPKGNGIKYGYLDKIFIGNSGDYKVPIASTNSYTQFNYTKYPVILVEGSTTILSNTASRTLFYISSGITSIDISKLSSSFLTGYTSTPRIEIINNNPANIKTFNESNLDTFFSVVNINDHGFNIGEKVTFVSSVEEIGQLRNNFVYYVGDVTEDSFRLYFNKDDAVLGGNTFVSFRNNFTVLAVTGTIKTDTRNPADFDEIDLDLSFNETTKTIDNIIIKNSGRGYLNAPTIRIVGGGKQPQTLPLSSSTGDIFTFRGGLISAANFDKDNINEINVSGLITTIFRTTPRLTVSAGSNATFTVFTSNGSISSVPIDNPGIYYFTEPSIQIDGVGSGAILKANNSVSTGRINSIDIINPGSGYNIAPVVRIIPSGGGGNATAELRTWTFNLSNRLTLDNYGGYVYNTTDDDLKSTNTPSDNLKFQHLTKNDIPIGLFDAQYLILKSSSNLNTYYQVSSTSHSKIIGWAYDGNPIYGKYAYSSRFDQTSSIVEMTSSWELKTSRVGGPTVAQYPLGTFIEDYQFVRGSGTLDEYNGRYCITPEFPNGTYAYFITDEFPYFVGLEYYSTLDSFNICTDRRNDKVPSKFTRINQELNPYYPKEFKSTSRSILNVNKITTGGVDKIVVENGGQNYKIGDKLIINNRETKGSGASGYVSRLNGRPITNYVLLELQDDGVNTVNYVEVTTQGSHGLAVGDTVYFDFTKDSSVYQNITLQATTVFLNRSINVKINTAFVANATFYYDIEGQLIYSDSDAITYESDGIKVKTDKIPETLYLLVNNTLYEIRAIDYAIKGPQQITKIVSATKFRVLKPEDFSQEGIDEIFYTTDSINTTGEIYIASISNKGANYVALPEITGVESSTGTGALLQFDSNSIGQLKKFNYAIIGEKFTNNKTIKYDVNIPYVAKILGNFEIYAVEVLYGGVDYISTDRIRVNGSLNPNYEFKITSNRGTILEVEVVRGGFYLSKIPTLTVDSLTGEGAILKPLIRRKRVFANDTIEFGTNNNVNIATIKNFDPYSSTIEFEMNSGEVNEYDIVYTRDNFPYGKIAHIRKASAHAKSHSFSATEAKFINNYGFLNDSTQKLLDSNYYQDWSYTLSSQQNIADWKSEVEENTHAAGFKVFGKKQIQARKSRFEKTEDIVKSSVVFSANFWSSVATVVDLTLDPSKCTEQYVAVNVIDGFNIGDYVYGATSGAKGRISSIEENYMEIQLIAGIEFELGEYISTVTIDFINGIDEETKSNLLFYSGILQQPFTAYSVSNSNIIPRFIVNEEDELTLYTIAGKFDLLDVYTANIGTTIPLTTIGLPFTPASKDHLLISVNGIVQKSDDLSLNGNIITITESLSRGSKCFILHRNTLRNLTLTRTNSTTYSINYTPSSANQLLLFVRGVGQSQLLTDYTVTNNIITLSEPIEGEIFGWFINEGVTAERILAQDLDNRKILDSRNCTIEKVTQFIESSKIDYTFDEDGPEGNQYPIYELNNQIIDGTLYADSDNQTIYGFDTKFRVTTPEYSSSYSEVVNPIVFNGVNTSFQMTYSDGTPYVPKNGKDSVIVNIDNKVLDYSQYNISGSTITFTTVYNSSNYCTITDYISSSTVNDGTVNSAKLDDLQISYNGTRKTFNLSYKGVPQYVRNNTDIFTIKNNLFLIPDTTTHTVSQNKITFTQAPISTDNIKLAYFNRQLGLSPNTNLIIDPIQTFDGNEDTFPLTIDGTLFTPVSVYNLYVIRAGVYQRPNIDYTINTTNITFNEAPNTGEEIIIFYSYNNINVNQYITDFIADGSSNTVNLGMIPPNADDLFVLRNGVFQNPLVDFTISGSTLTFTTSLLEDEPIFIMYTTASIKIGVSSFSGNTIVLNSTDYNTYIGGIQSEIESMILYANGVPKLYGKDYSITGTTITLLGPAIDDDANVFVIKYPNLTLVDDIEYFPDGSRTRFKLLYNGQNLNAAEILSDADILVLRNGIAVDPGTEYNININRTFIQFTNPPAADDVLLSIKMNNNTYVPLTLVSGNQYTTTTNITNYNYKNVVIFSNNKWNFFDAGDFTYNFTTSRFTLTTPHTSGILFGIIFDGDFKYLDPLNTPFNGQNNLFNMFVSQENFIPNTYTSSTPVASNILVNKNGKILDPGVDYTLNGIIGSQIQFATPPISSDKIEVRSIGHFVKLDSITSGINGTTLFNIRSNGSAYYPNANIERPRKHENQILVLRDGNIQSPLYDYYVDNDKLIFINPANASKLVILDYVGSYEDVQVTDEQYTVSPGDKIQLNGEFKARRVKQIISPTVLKTEPYTERKPSGFSAVAAVNSTTRKLTGITITSGGSGYAYPVILRTKGIGISAKAVANVNEILGNRVTTPITIQYSGRNLFNTPEVLATTYGYVYNKNVLESSTLSISTRLRTSLNTTSEIVKLRNCINFPQNPPVVEVLTLLGYPSGTGAVFRVFVSKNRIRKVEVVNGGSGYSEKYTLLNVTGGNGFGCVLVPTINTTTGQILSVDVKNGGESYDTFKAIIYDDTNDINYEIIEYTYSSHVSTPLTMTNYIANGTTTVTGTVSSTSGFAIGDVITISGAVGTQQEKLNGSWTIASVPNSTTFTFVVSSTVTTGTYTSDIGSTTRTVDTLFGCTRSTTPMSHDVNSKIYSDNYL